MRCAQCISERPVDRPSSPSVDSVCRRKLGDGESMAAPLAYVILSRTRRRSVPPDKGERGVCTDAPNEPGGAALENQVSRVGRAIRRSTGETRRCGLAPSLRRLWLPPLPCTLPSSSSLHRFGLHSDRLRILLSLPSPTLSTISTYLPHTLSRPLRTSYLPNLCSTRHTPPRYDPFSIRGFVHAAPLCGDRVVAVSASGYAVCTSFVDRSLTTSQSSCSGIDGVDRGRASRRRS